MAAVLPLILVYSSLALKTLSCLIVFIWSIHPTITGRNVLTFTTGEMLAVSCKREFTQKRWRLSSAATYFDVNLHFLTIVGNSEHCVFIVEERNFYRSVFIH